MKKLFYIVALVMSFSVNSFAAEKFITTGLNISQFYDAVAKPLPGYSFGFGWEWKTGRTSSLLFSPSYFYKASKLENKSVWNQDDSLHLEDILCRLGYVDLPFVIRRYSQDKTIFVSIGLAFALAIKDASFKKTKSTIMFPTGQRPGEHDFNVNIDYYPPIGGSIDLMLGGGKKINRFTIEGLLRISYGEAGTIKGINIHHQFITFSILGSYYL